MTTSEKIRFLYQILKTSDLVTKKVRHVVETLISASTMKEREIGYLMKRNEVLEDKNKSLEARIKTLETTSEKLVKKYEEEKKRVDEVIARNERYSREMRKRLAAEYSYQTSIKNSRPRR